MINTNVFGTSALNKKNNNEIIYKALTNITCCILSFFRELSTPYFIPFLVILFVVYQIRNVYSRVIIFNWFIFHCIMLKKSILLTFSTFLTLTGLINDFAIENQGLFFYVLISVLVYLSLVINLSKRFYKLLEYPVETSDNEIDCEEYLFQLIRMVDNIDSDKNAFFLNYLIHKHQKRCYLSSCVCQKLKVWRTQDSEKTQEMQIINELVLNLITIAIDRFPNNKFILNMYLYFKQKKIKNLWFAQSIDFMTLSRSSHDVIYNFSQFFFQLEKLYLAAEKAVPRTDDFLDAQKFYDINLKMERLYSKTAKYLEFNLILTNFLLKHYTSVSLLSKSMFTIYDTKQTIDSLLEELKPYRIKEVFIVAYFYYALSWRTKHKTEELLKYYDQLKRIEKESVHKKLKVQKFIIMRSSVNQDSLGKIVRISNNIKQECLYEPKELEGNSINRLMVPIIGQLHNSFIYEFFKVGTSSHVGVPFNNYLIKRNGFVYPIKILLKSSLNLQYSGFEFMAFLTRRKEVQFKNLILLNAQTLDIVGVNENLYNITGISPYFCQGFNENHSIANFRRIFPQMTEETFSRLLNESESRVDCFLNFDELFYVYNSAQYIESAVNEEQRKRFDNHFYEVKGVFEKVNFKIPMQVEFLEQHVLKNGTHLVLLSLAHNSSIVTGNLAGLVTQTKVEVSRLFVNGEMLDSLKNQSDISRINEPRFSGAKLTKTELFSKMNSQKQVIGEEKFVDEFKKIFKKFRLIKILNIIIFFLLLCALVILVVVDLIRLFELNSVYSNYITGIRIIQTERAIISNIRAQIFKTTFIKDVLVNGLENKNLINYLAFMKTIEVEDGYSRLVSLFNEPIYSDTNTIFKQVMNTTKADLLMFSDTGSNNSTTTFSFEDYLLTCMNYFFDIKASRFFDFYDNESKQKFAKQLFFILNNIKKDTEFYYSTLNILDTQYAAKVDTLNADKELFYIAYIITIGLMSILLLLNKIAGSVKVADAYKELGNIQDKHYSKIEIKMRDFISQAPDVLSYRKKGLEKKDQVFGKLEISHKTIHTSSVLWHMRDKKAIESENRDKDLALKVPREYLSFIKHVKQNIGLIILILIALGFSFGFLGYRKSIANSYIAQKQIFMEYNACQAEFINGEINVLSAVYNMNFSFPNHAFLNATAYKQCLFGETASSSDPYVNLFFRPFFDELAQNNKEINCTTINKAEYFEDYCDSMFKTGLDFGVQLNYRFQVNIQSFMVNNKVYSSIQNLLLTFLNDMSLRKIIFGTKYIARTYTQMLKTFLQSFGVFQIFNDAISILFYICFCIVHIYLAFMIMFKTSKDLNRNHMAVENFLNYID